MKSGFQAHPLRLIRFCILSLAGAFGLFSSHPLRAQTLATALDAPQLTWTNSASFPWVGQTNVTRDGVDAARSGTIGNSQESWLQTTVTGPGTLIFWWKVSSESGFDYLEFRVNDVPSGSISGEANWEQRTFDLGAGNHTLRWRYAKDFVDSAGQDRGWVDLVSFVTPTGPPVIAVQPQSQSVVQGAMNTLSVVAGGAPPLSYQWFKSAIALNGQTNSSFSIPMVQTNDAGSYIVIITNTLGAVTSAPAALTVTASVVDSAFNPGANGNVYAVAGQVDGKILVGGDFTTLAGQPCNRLGRLNPDGTLDASFNPDANGGIRSIVIQSDGKILVGGDFSALGGVPRSSVGRLNMDGTVDNAFNPGGFGAVNTLLVQPDGKVLVGGNYLLDRLNTNGTPDNTFANLDLNGEVFSFARQTDGAILVGGQFSILVPDSDGDLIAYFNLVRLNSSGGIDENYYPDPDNGVSCIALQADGQALVSGYFSSFNAGGQAHERIARVNGNGDLVTAFAPELDGDISSIALQTDGKILLSGNFSTLNGQPRGGLGRLNSSGTVDFGFNVGVDGEATSLMVQSDGKVVVGGSFSTADGRQRDNIARLNNTATATQTLSYAGSTITWLRSGSGPEVGTTIFEHSSDGTNWTSLGAGTRISGGWQRTGVSLPAGRTLRARGRAAGGYQNNSSGFAQKFYGRPLLISQPTNRTNVVGDTVSFAAEARGSDPLTYQWYKNGVRLTNQGNITGATNATLQLSPVAKTNEAAYHLVVSNSFGSVTSVVATLALPDPFIISPPASTNRNSGQSVMFSVTAGGTLPLSYQWFHDGVEMPGATGPSLQLQNLTRTNAGIYSVVVSNTQGTATGGPVLLTVNVTTLDSAFNTGDFAIFDSAVYGLAIQADGKILVGGTFSWLGGQQRSCIGRLNAGGTLDGTFNPGAVGSNMPAVFALAPQTDGKILVGGQFSTLAGQTRSLLGRLDSDGSLDNSFNPGATGGMFASVNCLVVQADGKILVGGLFNTLAGQTRTNLGRLNTNGTLDTAFTPTISGGVTPNVYCLSVQPDGKILVGGMFANLAGQLRNNLGRLNTNGTLDATFNPNLDSAVYAMALQADGKIVIGGEFLSVGGQTREGIARLNPDGTLDLSFNASADSPIFSIALQTDGKIVVAGGFGVLNESPRKYIGRLNSNGTLDGIFNPAVEEGSSSFPGVFALGLQADGKIIVAGDFSSLNGQARHRIGRLSNTDGAINTLSYSGSTVTWLRGGTGPEVWRATFEHSLDGLAWTDLGTVQRTNGGWRLNAVTLPANGTLRARGHVSGSPANGSNWFVESTLNLNPPLLLSLVRNGGSLVLSWTGGAGTYQLQQTTNLLPPVIWQDLGSPIQTNSVTLPVGDDTTFWRVRQL